MPCGTLNNSIGRAGPQCSETRSGQRTTVGATRLVAHRAGNSGQATEGRWGSREVEIVDVSCLDREGQPSFVFHTGDPMSVRVRVRAAHPPDAFVFGIGLFNTAGVCCYGRDPYPQTRHPRELHRTAALTGTALIALHIGTLLFDPFAQLRLVDFVVPFLGSYRPVWLGLGTPAVDLPRVITTVSLVRAPGGPRPCRGGPRAGRRPGAWRG